MSGSALLRDLVEGRVLASDWLLDRSKSSGLALESVENAAALDAEFPCHREKFCIPKKGQLTQTDTSVTDADEDSIYLCGNSLGLQPKATRELVNEELDKWAASGVNGHFEGARPWMPIEDTVVAKSASVVGALDSEVAVMNSLTMNLHLLFVSFYRPAAGRTKILYESDAFPSDYHAFKSQARLHGVDPEDALLPVRPREGNTLLTTEDIVESIKSAGSTLAIVCLGAVQYYTGQYFDIPTITAAAHSVGATCVWDCAHAAGNVNLKLHEWDVDGACWCTYKYMNSGPGGIGGFFVHEKHHSSELPVLAGWWGHTRDSRFDMKHEWDPIVGAASYQVSNPPVLQTVSLLASLNVFALTSMEALRGRSMLLTAYLEMIMTMRAAEAGVSCSSITPKDPQRRGCQLSLKFGTEQECVSVFDRLTRRGVVMDHRKPNVLRFAPAPLYNTFGDLERFGRELAASLIEESASKQGV